MSFSSAGEHRVVLQQYKFGSHQIFCICKILPDTVSLYGKDPEKDFNWMTTGRWARLENGLWRLFASLTDWPEDARKLNNQMLIDNMQVLLSVAGEQLQAAQKFLQDSEVHQDDIGLEIVLRYMSHEDRTTTTYTQTEKPKHSDKTKTSDKAKSTMVQSSARKIKKKTKSIEPVEAPHDMAIDSNSVSKKKLKSRKSDPKIAMPDDNFDFSSYVETKQKSEIRKPEKPLQDADNEPSTIKIPESPKINRKRERRSVSHGTENAKKSPKEGQTTPTRGRSRKRSKSPTARSSERRSARSLMRPVRYDDFMLSKQTKKGQSKPAESNADSNPKVLSTKHKPKDTTNGNDSSWQCAPLDGADHANMSVLRNINKLLEIPKPRKVEIFLLKDMSEAAVIKTFDSYRPDFDRFFKEREHKSYTTSYKGIDHCHIMDILNETIHNSMIQKLGSIYNKKSPHGALVINGLLPLWIIRLFMDEYKFTQDEAIKHISDQLKYYTYLKAVNNEPLCADMKNL